MAGTIDLGTVKVDTKKAQKSVEDLDLSIAGLKEGVKKYAIETASLKEKNDQLAKSISLAEAAIAKTEEQAKSTKNAFTWLVAGMSEVGNARRHLEVVSDSQQKLTVRVQAGVLAAVSYTRAFDAVSDTAQRYAGIVGDVVRAATQGALAEESHRRALTGLHGAYNQISAATHGAVTAEQAFAAQNQITQSGLRVSGDQLAMITRAAREFAVRTGTDSAQAVQQLTAALVAGDAQAMRPFGINVRVGTLRTQAFREALGQLGTQQRNTATEAETLAESTARLGRAWEAYKSDAAAALADTLDLKNAFRELADALESMVDGGPLVHNFFSGILEDITGIQQTRRGTADDNERNNAVLARQRAGNALAQWANVPGIDVTGFNANSLSPAAAERLSRALSSGTADPVRIQAEIDRARGITRVQAADRIARLNAPTNNPAQNRRDDDEERRRNRSELDDFQLAEDQRQAREQVNSKIRELAAQGISTSPAMRARLMGLIAGFLNPLNRAQFSAEMSRLEGQSSGLSRGGRFGGLGGVQSRYGQGLTNQQYLDLASADRDKVGAAAEMGGTIGAINRAGRRYAGDSVLLGGSSTDTLFDRFGRNLSADTYGQLAEAEQGKAGARAEMGATVAGLGRRNDLSQQVGSFFSDTQTLAEKGAKGVEGAFNSMSGAVSGFIDTLIEGQVPAGEAAVGLAKAALKGLAMQALPESLFETAKGIAALAVGDPRAALHFTSAGIFAGIAVAAGAGAAGIGAAQRAATPSASASTPAAQYTPLGGSSGGQQQGGGTVIFNINSTVFDPERSQETVMGLYRDAVRRGI